MEEDSRVIFSLRKYCFLHEGASRMDKSKDTSKITWVIFSWRKYCTLREVTHFSDGQIQRRFKDKRSVMLDSAQTPSVAKSLTTGSFAQDLLTQYLLGGSTVTRPSQPSAERALCCDRGSSSLALCWLSCLHRRDASITFKSCQLWN